VDLSAELLETCRANIRQAGLEAQVRFVVGDARDLGQVRKQNFDAALIMGPLYHLILADDRSAALEQVYRRLKPGGIVVSAFISRFGILGDLMRDVPAWIEDREDVRSLLASGQRPPGAPRGGFRGYFARSQEIAPLHEAVGFETLVLAGSEPAISADDASYNRLEGTQRQLWLDLLYQVSREESTLAASRHLLYIGRKPAGA
jgi:SAM-dependent methyltransferase